jgi:cysteine desulfurase
MGTIYLDNNSTTPCDPAVVEAMLPFFGEAFGNPGSPHVLGRRAADAVERAREQVARLVGCNSSEIIFTGGATESCNLAILGISAAAGNGQGLVCTSVEHKAVLEPCAHLERRGVPVTRVPVSPTGVVDVAAFRRAMKPSLAIVSIQAANNEVGVLQPIKELAEIAAANGVRFHCDAAQAMGKIPFDVTALGVDFASFSAHKVYGPKGVGALYVRAASRHAIAGILFGGGQEGGLRPGTLSVPAIVGFGAACDIAARTVGEDSVRLRTLRDGLERDLLDQIPGSFVNGSEASRLPGTCSLTIPKVAADLMIANLPSVCVSNGSACSSGALAPSHVLLAMGLSREDADCTLRISLGRQNEADEIRKAVGMIVEAALQLQREIG